MFTRIIFLLLAASPFRAGLSAHLIIGLTEVSSGINKTKPLPEPQKPEIMK